MLFNLFKPTKAKDIEDIKIFDSYEECQQFLNEIRNDFFNTPTILMEYIIKANKLKILVYLKEKQQFLKACKNMYADITYKYFNGQDFDNYY